MFLEDAYDGSMKIEDIIKKEKLFRERLEKTSSKDPILRNLINAFLDQSHSFSLFLKTYEDRT